VSDHAKTHEYEFSPEVAAALERAGEQKPWRCPQCGYRTEVLSALMVWCGPCRDERKRLVSMVQESSRTVGQEPGKS
jgi:rubrerythrin